MKGAAWPCGWDRLPAAPSNNLIVYTWCKVLLGHVGPSSSSTIDEFNSIYMWGGMTRWEQEWHCGWSQARLMHNRIMTQQHAFLSKENLTEIYQYVPLIWVNCCFELYRYFDGCIYVCVRLGSTVYIWHFCIWHHSEYFSCDIKEGCYIIKDVTSFL